MVTTDVRTPVLPALVRGTVRHMRHQPFRHGLRMHTYQWLIDVDAPPSLTPLVDFPVRDHFGGHAATLREAVTAFVRGQGGAVAADERILMLAGGRSFGHAFDPLSVFWGIGPEGDMRWAVLEIHNTYGDRHGHLVHPERGRARVSKAFYVSPFFPIDGEYTSSLVLDHDRIAVSIVLERDGQTAFTASFVGTPLPISMANVARALVRTPLATWQTSLRIRVHGIWLWLRRLPVVPRPVHDPQVGFR